MILLVKFGILMLSYFGYWEYSRSKYHISPVFAPAFTIAFQFSMLFLAGLLNVLLEATVLLQVLGLVLAILAISRKRLSVVKPYIHGEYAILAVSCLLAALAVRNVEIVDADSIHHWSLITNTMLQTDRFPNFQDTIITFKGYPLGSAVCIYYFCRFTSRWEDVQLLAQVFILGCMFLPVLFRMKKHGIFCVIFAAIAYNFLLCYNGSIYDLRVDTLLPICGTAMILFCYDIAKREASNRVPIFCAVPFFCFCSQIKNSGIFFCLIGAIVLLVCNKEREYRIKSGVVCLTPLMSMYMWKRHYAYVFANAAMTKHAMSSDWYSYVLSEKTLQDCVATINGVLHYAFTRRELIWLVTWLVGIYLINRFCLNKTRKHSLRLPLCILGVYFAYMAGICGMYLLSMPKAEAQTMGDIGRYTKTVDIAIYCLIVSYVIYAESQISVAQKRNILGAFMVLLMIATWRISLNAYSSILKKPERYGRELGTRQKYQQLLEEYGVETGYKYLVLEKHDIYEDSYFYIKYLLNSGDVYVLDVSEPAQLDLAEECQYIFVFDQENAVVNQWLDEQFPEYQGQAIIYNF